MSSSVADLQSTIGGFSGSRYLATVGSGGSSLSSPKTWFSDGNGGTPNIDVPLNASDTLVMSGADFINQSAPINVGKLLIANWASTEGVTLTNASNVIGSVAGGAGGANTTIYSSSNVAVDTVAGVSGFTFGQNTLQSAGSITLNSPSTANGITLVDGTTFTNNAGSNALGSTFQVWSQYPANDNRGGLAYDYKVYGATYAPYTDNYGSQCFLYVQQPHLTATLTGPIQKTYDSTNVASAGSSNITLSNLIDGDTGTATGTGTYVDKNAGTSKSTTINSFSTSVSNGAATVYGYLDPPTVTANVGEIDQFPINFQVNGANKPYDSTTVAIGSTVVATPGTPIFAGDDLHVSGANLNFASSHIGNGITISASGSPVLAGNDAGNYLLGTIANGSANISTASLSLLYTAITRAYNQTTTATGSAAIVGMIPGDNITITGTPTASFVDKNAGVNKTVNVSGIGLTGSDLANYSWSGSPVGIGTITPAPLTATITGNSKVYNGTTAATVNGNTTPTGVYAVTVSRSAVAQPGTSWTRMSVQAKQSLHQASRCPVQTISITP